MGAIVISLSLLIVGAASLVVPWLGVAAGYLIGILNPQSIWWWHFEGLRPVYLVLLPTLIGVFIYSFRQGVNWSAITNRRMVCLYLVWAMGMLSLWFAPASSLTLDVGEPEIRSSAYFMETLSKIILLAILGSVCVQSGRQARNLGLALVIPVVYLTYWINHRYLSGAAWGRIGGPVAPNGLGAYQDENVFGVLFVAATPFLWYAGLYAKRLGVKAAFWLILLFSWHGVFLTGSRGALIALGAALATIAFRMKSKTLGILMVLAFAGAFAWQAGDTMKARIFSIDDYEEDASATGRLDAWNVGLEMVKAHPLTGVGPGSFIRSFPEYSELTPLQAHNTFVQFAAEFGLIAALAFVYLLWSSIRSLWQSAAAHASRSPDDEGFAWVMIAEASLAALIGVSVASLFLSLQLFEVTYFLILISNLAIVNTPTDKV